MEVWTDVNLVERPEDQEAIERQIQQQILDEKMSRELVAELAAYEQAGSHQAQLQPQRSTDAEEHYNSSATQLHATIQQDDLASLQLARSWAQSQREQSQQPSRPAKSGRRTGEHERERQSLIASERARQQQLQLDFERKHQLQKKGLPDETYEMPEQQQQQQLEGQHRQQQRRQQQPDGQPEGQQQPQKQSSSHQSCSANPWSFVPALHLRPNQYGLIEPPRDSHLAAHGFELVKLVKVDRFQETCVAEFLEPKDTSGAVPAYAQRFGRYTCEPNGEACGKSGWRGTLVWSNFFYGFPALEGGLLPTNAQEALRTYLAERARRICAAEAAEVCESEVISATAEDERPDASSSIPGFRASERGLKQRSSSPQPLPSSDGDSNPHRRKRSRNSATDAGLAVQDQAFRDSPEPAQSSAAPSAAHDSLIDLYMSESVPGSQVLQGLSERPQSSRPRNKQPAKSLAVASARGRTAMGLADHAAGDGSGPEDDVEYLPCSDEQDSSVSLGNENDDGGFLEDMQSLEPSRRQESGRKAYRDGLAHLQKANRLQQICRYKLDPVELNQVAPAFTAPWFLYEQVYGVGSAWEEIARTIYEELYEHPPVIMDSCPRFSRARRQRTYTTNIRGHHQLPLPLEPNLEDALGLSTLGLPVWMSELYEAGYFNTVNTRLFPSRKCGHCISRWVAANPGQPLPKVIHIEKVIEGDKSGSKYEARKIAARYNLVADKKHRLGAMPARQAEALMGYAPGHTRRAGPNDGSALGQEARREMLGNSFQTTTVAHLLQPLKALQDSGKLTKQLVVLSLFDGMGGAAVALREAGVSVAKYIAVETERNCQGVVERYFCSLSPCSLPVPDLAYPTDMDGLPVHDVKHVHNAWLRHQISNGGIHLIIGGSPCNNITGSNRVSKNRLGFSGQDSHLFSHFARILRVVKDEYSRRKSLSLQF